MSDFLCSARLVAELGDDPARQLIVHVPRPRPVGGRVLERDPVPDLRELLRMEVGDDD